MAADLDRADRGSGVLQAGPGSFRPGGTPPGSWGSFAGPGRTPAGLGEDFLSFYGYFGTNYI